MSSWPVLGAAGDPAGEPYKRNAEVNEALAVELRERLAVAARGGPERARTRHVGRGNARRQRRPAISAARRRAW